jgi:hypothetical protein
MSKHTITFNFPWIIVLTVILAITKVTAVLAISWWIVFIPVLIPLAWFLLFGLIIAFLFVFGVLLASLAS